MRASASILAVTLMASLAGRAVAEGPGSVLQATNCDWASFRVVTLSEPKVISTYQFMPDQNSELANFVAGYQLNIRPKMDTINDWFVSSDLWRNIQSQGDCQTRYDDPSASATTNGNNLHVRVAFRVKRVACDSLYPGSRLDSGAARYAVVIAVWPELKYVDGAPELTFRTDLASTSMQTSAETAFLWDTVGRALGKPSRADAAQAFNQTVADMLEGPNDIARDIIDDANSDLKNSLDNLLQAGGSDQLSSVTGPLRQAFIQSMKPATVSWMPDFTSPNRDLTLRFEPEIKRAADGMTVFPFQQKKSVMCALAHATAGYFIENRDKYKIVEMYTMNGQVTDSDEIYRMLR